MKESSPKVKPWRDSVVAAAPAIERRLDGPLAVKMVFTVARPKAAAKRLTRPFTLPDLSKYARSTEDGITTAGLWADDGRVQDYVRLAKVWTGYDADALPVPGVVVACTELDGELDDKDYPASALLDQLYSDVCRSAWGRIRGAA